MDRVPQLHGVGQEALDFFDIVEWLDPSHVQRLLVDLHILLLFHNFFHLQIELVEVLKQDADIRVRNRAFLVLDISLNVIDRVIWINIRSDGFTCEHHKFAISDSSIYVLELGIEFRYLLENLLFHFLFSPIRLIFGFIDGVVEGVDQLKNFIGDLSRFIISMEQVKPIADLEDLLIELYLVFHVLVVVLDVFKALDLVHEFVNVGREGAELSDLLLHPDSDLFKSLLHHIWKEPFQLQKALLWLWSKG